MATTTTTANYGVPYSWPGDTRLCIAEYRVDDESNLAVINDIIKVIKLPDLVRVCAGSTRLSLGQFDSNGTPTATFSVILTNGTTSYEIIKDAAIGRTATDGDSAFPGDANSVSRGDELDGYHQVTSGGLWEIQIKLTAALATATSASRFVNLEVGYIAAP